LRISILAERFEDECHVFFFCFCVLDHEAVTYFDGFVEPLPLTVIRFFKRDLTVNLLYSGELSGDLQVTREKLQATIADFAKQLAQQDVHYTHLTKLELEERRENQLEKHLEGAEILERLGTLGIELEEMLKRLEEHTRGHRCLGWRWLV